MRTVALLCAPDARPERNASWFAEWLMSDRAREVLRTLRDPYLPQLYVPGEHE